MMLTQHAALAVSSPPRFIVDLREEQPPVVLAALTCVGLLNRDSHNNSIAGPAYSIMNSGVHDLEWLENLHMAPPSASNFTTLDDLMHRCLTDVSVSAGYILYNFSAQQVAVPNIITLAAVLDAVPLEAESPFLRLFSPKLIFDAVATFGLTNVTSLQVTTFVFDVYGSLTTSMSMMNPGYNYSDEWLDFNPPLTSLPDLAMTDFVVKFRIFNFFLVNGCIEGTDEHVLMERMVMPTATSWPQPIPVFGYNGAWRVFGGAPIFEAQTTCVSQRNIGECATYGFNNLAFFSRSSPITLPLVQNPQPRKLYNQSKTYVTIIMGDGDNTLYLKTTRMDMMKQRQARCQRDPTSPVACFSLMWTFSSWMLTFAPEMLKWYYSTAAATTHDYFMFPPSGYLYSYPSEMPGSAQDSFVRHLEDRAYLMNTSSTVTWESFLDWKNAIDEFYPKYAKDGVIGGVFTVNVPFMIPIFEFGFQSYLVLRNANSSNGTAILFNSREWRGTNASLSPPFGQLQYPTALELAEEINAGMLGSIASIYCTTDGGFTLDDLYELVPNLAKHVEVVSADQLIDLARQRSNVV